MDGRRKPAKTQRPRQLNQSRNRRTAPNDFCGTSNIPQIPAGMGDALEKVISNPESACEFKKSIEQQIPLVLEICRKKFNVTITALINGMRAIFTDDIPLATLESTISGKMGDGKSDSVLVMYANNILPNEERTIDFGKLIMEENEDVMTSPALQIPILKAINIKDKWAKLSGENKKVVWDLLKCMTEQSIQYMYLSAMTPDQLIELSVSFMHNGGDVEKTAAGINSKLVLTGK